MSLGAAPSTRREMLGGGAALKLPAVRAAIAKGRPLIAGFGDQVETRPVGVGIAVIVEECPGGTPTSC